MIDRERVMKELSWIINNFPKQKDPKDAADKMCTAINTYCSDALSLLKEQEARVMTLEEVDESRGVNVWAEIHSPHVNRLVLVYCAVRRSETIPKFYNLIEDSGVMWSRTDTDYNADEFFGIRSGWRCWTSRPTPEHMRDTPWEGEKD